MGTKPFRSGDKTPGVQVLENFWVDRVFSDLGETRSDGIFDEPHLIMDVQFVHDVGFVGLHGLFADREKRGNLGNGVSLGDHLQDLSFPAGKKILCAALHSLFCPPNIFFDHLL